MEKDQKTNITPIDEDEKVSKKTSLSEFLLNHLNDLISNRITHPIIGSIIISFIIFNWKTILLIFLPISNDATILTIGDRVNATVFSPRDFIIPIIIGFIYTIGIPYLTWFYTTVIKTARIGIKKIKEEERSFRSIEALNNKIKENKSTIEELENNLNNKVRHNSFLDKQNRTHLKEIEKQSQIINNIERRISAESNISSIEVLAYIKSYRLMEEKASLENELHNYKFENDERYRNEIQYGNDYDDYDERLDPAATEKRLSEIEIDLRNKKTSFEKFESTSDTNTSN